MLALDGIDPRGWDLNRLLAAFEATMRRNAKDEAAWRRMDASLRAEPREVREERRRNGAPAPSRMSVEAAEAMIAQFAASEAMFG